MSSSSSKPFVVVHQIRLLVTIFIKLFYLLVDSTDEYVCWYIHIYVYFLYIYDIWVTHFKFDIFYVMVTLLFIFSFFFFHYNLHFNWNLFLHKFMIRVKKKVSAKNPVNIQVSKWIVENNGNNGDNKIEKKYI